MLVLWYLIRRPALTNATKIVLLLGIGVLPLAAATTGNVAGYEATKSRRFWRIEPLIEGRAKS